jgi:DNA primase
MSLADYKAFVEEVRNKNRLKDVIGGEAELIRHGKGYKCKSPLRQENDPSFFIYEDEGWYDFGISEGGDVFDYIQRRYELSFSQAVNKLAERAGIAIQHEAHMDADVREFVENTIERRYIYKILTSAAHHFHRKMTAEIRQRVKDQYGFTDETIDTFRIGWADGTLKEYLRKEGFDDEKLLKTGLFFKFEDGRFADLFDKRITFPYWKNGQVAYFIGRRIDGITSEADHEKAKYKKQLTSPKHEYVSEYITNDVFYGEDTVKNGQDIIITEGVTDCISAIQSNFNCISPVTIRFKKSDIPKLIELTEKCKIIYIVNDEENAKTNPLTGHTSQVALEGAMQTAQALFEAGRDVRIVRLPKTDEQAKVDLNSFLKDYNAETLSGVLLDGKSFPRIIIEAIPKDIDIEQIDFKLSPVYDVLAKCKPMQRDAYIDVITRKFKSVKKSTVLKEVSKRAKKATDESLDSGWSRTGQIYEDTEHSRYYFSTKDGNTIISSFKLEPKEKLITDFGEVIRTRIFTERGEVIDNADFHISSWKTRRDFVTSALRISTNLQWVGNDDHVQGLLRIISGISMPKYRGTDMLGYYEDKDGPRWVSKDMVISPNGIMTEPNVKYIPSGVALENKLGYEFPNEQELKNLAQQAIPLLMEANEPEIMVPLIGWFTASLISPVIRAVSGSFPILWVWGSAGSGKTTVIKDLMWPLTGVCKNRDMFSATDTLFTQIRTCASSTSIPICIDEYRRDMGKTKKDQCHRIARRIYNGDSEQRGRADQSLAFYRLVAPLCFVGEMLPNDAAILERIICVLPDKNALTPDRQDNYQKLMRLPIHKLAGPLIRFAMGRSIIGDLSMCKKFVERILENIGGKDVSPRIKTNLIAMAVGNFIWEEFASSLGITLPSFDANNIFKSLITNASRSESGMSSVRDSADEFVSDLSTYAGLGLLQEGIHYTILAQKEDDVIRKKIYIRLKLCYEVYLKEKKNSGQEDETNGYDALKLLISQKIKRGSYFFSKNHRVKFGDSQYSCIGIDPSLIPEELDFEIFPHSNVRTWGRVGWNAELKEENN